MKRLVSTVTIALIASSAWIAFAQEEGNTRRERGGGGGDFLARLPVYKALDKDGNGELSAEEIKNASAALLTLDADKDGKLSGEVIAPALRTRVNRGAAGGANRPSRPSRPSSDKE